MLKLPHTVLALCIGLSVQAYAAGPEQPAFPDEAPVQTYADDPIVGWHWYNEPEEQPEPEEEKTVPLSTLPPSTQMALLQGLTKQKLNEAILSPSPEHAADYLRLQGYLVRLSGQFTRSASQALLKYPDLDYNLKQSHYNNTVPLQLAAQKRDEQQAIAVLGQRYGLFLFYRGGNAIDNEMAKTVAAFSQQYGLSLIPVSMDGTRSPDLPQTRPDSGQAQHMQVTQFPALFLVAPDAQRYQPLAYGFMTRDDLARRFLDVATGFTDKFEGKK